MKRYPLILYYVLTLAISGIILYGLIAANLENLFFLATFGPAIAGFITARIVSGTAGFRELLQRILVWKVGLGWWLAALFLPLIVALGGIYVGILFGGSALDFGTLQPLYMIVPLILMLTLLNGFGEEYGWRGFALPRLQARYNALVSSLVLGFFWGIWHAPVYFVDGTFQYALAAQGGFWVGLAVFTVTSMAASILATAIFNHTKGSVLLAGVFHGAVNAWIGYFLTDMSYAFPVGVGMAISSIVVALIVVIVFGAKNLSRQYERNTIPAEFK